jgi:hypothetical protein
MDQMVNDSDCRVDRRSGVFDCRLGEICFALGYANRLTGCFAAISPIFKSDTGTIFDCNSHTFAYSKGNSRRDPDCDAVSKSSAYPSVSTT